MSALGIDPDLGSGVSQALDPNWGFIHSEQTGSSLDGPGLRTVFWLTGCGFRCKYCHNPDTWKLQGGRRVHVDSLIRDIVQYAPFFSTVHGGVTVSGGEPLVQHAFCTNLMRRLHALDIHTALDTNGFLGNRLSNEELRAIDLVILDLKSWDDETHVHVTGQHNRAVLDFARRLQALGRPAWIRFVLVPGLTDRPENVNGLARFCGELSNVERVEVVPFHQLGRLKWRDLGLDYELEDSSPPTDEQLQSVRDTFRRFGSICPD
jgi:pyruvate formate lyase activating enzyme